MIDNHRTPPSRRDLSTIAPPRIAASQARTGPTDDTGYTDAAPHFVADSLGRKGPSSASMIDGDSRTSNVAEALRGFTEYERRTLSAVLKQACNKHPDAQAGLQLLGATHLAMEGMPVKDWPAVAAAFRTGLQQFEREATMPTPPNVRGIALHMSIDPLEALFLELMKMQISIGRAAARQYVKVLDRMVDAAKRKGEAMISEAGTNFSYAVVGAIVSSGMSIGGAQLKLCSAKQTIVAREKYTKQMGTLTLPGQLGNRSQSIARCEFSKSKMEIKNEMQISCTQADRLSTKGDVAATVGRALADVSRPLGELAARQYAVAQLHANTDQTIYESLRNDEKERISKALQMTNSFQSDYRAYMDKRAGALDAAASSRLA